MSFYEYDFLLDDKFNFNSFDPNESFQHSSLNNSFYNFGNEKKRTIFKLSNIDTLKEFISDKTEPISNGFMYRQENIINPVCLFISYVSLIFYIFIVLHLIRLQNQYVKKY